MYKQNQCVIRLQKEYIKIQKDPVPNIMCKPLQNNILEWHYCIYGIEDKTSPYYNGFYHGKLSNFLNYLSIVFPPEYPYKPPSIMMITPSGRFQTNTRLCLSMSDFHPETWNPVSK